MRLRVLAATSVAASVVVFMVQGCRGEVDRNFIEDGLDGSDDSSSIIVNDANTDHADGSGSGSDGSGDGSVQSDGSSTDGGTDGGATDGDAGTVNDSATDAKTDADAATVNDAADASDGCGPPNTITNCGGCGRVCNTTTASVTPLCSGGTCLYSCLPGRFDCNNTAPNLDGCECAGGCCGASCQTTHSNGLGGTFYDCNPLGTYNQQQAIAACTAFTGDATKCAPYGCTGNAGLVVCTPEAYPLCTCWKYDPGNTGVNGTVATNCTCTSPTPWN